MFHQLSDALTVLVDESTRKAYDNVLKARKAAELRSRCVIRILAGVYILICPPPLGKKYDDV